MYNEDWILGWQCGDMSILPSGDLSYCEQKAPFAPIGPADLRPPCVQGSVGTCLLPQGHSVRDGAGFEPATLGPLHNPPAPELQSPRITFLPFPIAGTGDSLPEESGQQPSARHQGGLPQSASSSPRPQTHSVLPARRVHPLLQQGTFLFRPAGQRFKGGGGESARRR